MLFTENGVTDLKLSVKNSDTLKSAYGINPNGLIIGRYDTDSGSTHAFLSASQQLTDLGTLGGSDSEALGINQTGTACRFEQLSSARGSKAPTLEGLHARRVCSFTMSRQELGVRRPHPRPQTEPHLQKPFQSAAKALQQINRIGSLVPFTIIGGSTTDTESEERVPNLLGLRSANINAEPETDYNKS